MFKRANNVFDRRHRKQTSWTSFESPFFGGVNRSSPDDSKDDNSAEWSPSVSKGKPRLKTIYSDPSTPVTKRSGKSVATATTASVSTATGATTAGRLHSPHLSEEFKLPDPAAVTYGGRRKAYPVLDMNEIPQLPGMSGLSRVKKALAMKKRKMESQDKPQAVQIGMDDNVSLVETAASSSDEESDTPSQEGRRSRRTQQQNHQQQQDSCMPMVMEDFREIATTSMTKALVVFNHVSIFFNEKMDPGACTRGAFGSHSRSGRLHRPTTVFIMPKSSRSKSHHKYPMGESFGGESGHSHPPMLVDDEADDMSSLTEPRFFLLEKPFPPVSKFKHTPSTKKSSPLRGKKGQIQVNLDDNGEECIEFETSSIDLTPIQGEDLLDDEPLDHDAAAIEPKPQTTAMAPASPSLFAKLDSPFQASPARTEELSSEVLGDKISDVSTELMMNPGNTDLHFRFPFGKFRPRSMRSNNSFLQGELFLDQEESAQSHSLSEQRKTSTQPKNGNKPTKIQVIWGKDIPKPGIVRSLRKQLQWRRLTKVDLESVEC